jgi:dihydrofolate reductase
MKMTQRSVILGMNTSLDGYVADAEGGLDWMWPTMDPAQGESVVMFLRSVDTVLIGHNTYVEQAAHWPGQVGEMADLLNAHTKVVFSSRQEMLAWDNSRLASADAATEIGQLKQEPGKDIFVTGGATLAQSLARLGLIDEYKIAIHPTVLGAGMPLFADVPETTRFALVECTSYGSGTVDLHYRRV